MVDENCIMINQKHFMEAGAEALGEVMGEFKKQTGDDLDFGTSMLMSVMLAKLTKNLFGNDDTPDDEEEEHHYVVEATFPDGVAYFKTCAKDPKHRKDWRMAVFTSDIDKSYDFTSLEEAEDCCKTVAKTNPHLTVKVIEVYFNEDEDDDPDN